MIFFFFVLSIDKNILRFFFNLGVKVTLPTCMFLYLLYHEIFLCLVVITAWKMEDAAMHFRRIFRFEILSVFCLLLNGILTVSTLQFNSDRSVCFKHGYMQSTEIVLYKFVGKPICVCICILLEAVSSRRQAVPLPLIMFVYWQNHCSKNTWLIFSLETLLGICLSVSPAQVKGNVQHKLPSKFRFDSHVPKASLVHWKMPKSLACATAMYLKCLSRICF